MNELKTEGNYDAVTGKNLILEHWTDQLVLIFSLEVAKFFLFICVF
jgi:hypothetical protein